MSDRRRTQRPTLPVGYQYCETRDRNVYSELMCEAHRLIAEDMATFERDMSLRQRAALTEWGDVMDTSIVQAVQRTGDETL